MGLHLYFVYEGEYRCYFYSDIFTKVELEELIMKGYHHISFKKKHSVIMAKSNTRNKQSFLYTQIPTYTGRQPHTRAQPHTSLSHRYLTYSSLYTHRCACAHTCTHMYPCPRYMIYNNMIIYTYVYMYFCSCTHIHSMHKQFPYAQRCSCCSEF